MVQFRRRICVEIFRCQKAMFPEPTTFPTISNFHELRFTTTLNLTIPCLFLFHHLPPVSSSSTLIAETQGNWFPSAARTFASVGFSSRFRPKTMYPKVKVRQEQYKEDRRVKQDNNLKALLSLSPRVSPSPGLTGPEKDDNLDEDRVNIRASPIPLPRTVISSPINDAVIGNKNRIKGRERLPGSKNNGVLQNRHALCKVKSSNVAENSANMRKPMEAADKSSNLTDSVQKRRPTKSASNQKTKMIIAHPKKWEF